MTSFDMLHRVETYLRTGSFPSDCRSENCYTIKRAAKKYIHKDGHLFRKHRGRLLRVVLSNEQAREVMQQLHNNKSHPGRRYMVQKIMSMYYWGGVTRGVKEWIQNCDVCKSLKLPKPRDIVKACLAYGCDASSFLHPELSFHKFPKAREQRQQWLVIAQRDEGSIRRSSFLCARHFEPYCFLQSEDGQEVLRSDAVPTIMGVSKQQVESQPSDPVEPSFYPSSLEDLLTSAAVNAEVCPMGSSEEQNDPPHKEHQYSMRVPEPHPQEAPADILESRQGTSFSTYNQIARYLSHRTVPDHIGKHLYFLKRKTKRFTLVDGVLMYKMRSTSGSRLVKVPRSREEVNSILQQFHDNCGHFGFHTCFQALLKEYYWSSASKDLHSWISRCPTCLNSTTKWLRCSIMNCTNYCGPVERKLGLTFHKFPIDCPSLLSRWKKAAGRSPNWHPRLWSSVCSAHFTDDCFDRSGGQVELIPDAVPTVKTHGDKKIQCLNEGQAAAETEDTEEQDEAFFAKFDAVELYISTKTYPPGLTFVEKNTFRRLCKNYTVKDEVLYIKQRDRVVPVLRNRAQVNEALKEFHDEFNHLDVKKCLRLLSERCFWKNMRPDIKKWISKCSVCCWKNKLKKKPLKRRKQILPPPLGMHSDSEVEEAVGDEYDAFSETTKTESNTKTAEKAIEPEPQKKVHMQTKVQPQDQPQVQAQTQEQIPIQSEIIIPFLEHNQVQKKVQAPIQVKGQMKVQPQVQSPAGTQAPVQTGVHTSSQPQVHAQTKVQNQIQTQVQARKQKQSKVKSPVQTKTQVQDPVQVQPEVQTLHQTQLKIHTQVLTQVQAPAQSTVQTQVFLPAMVQSQDQPRQTIPVFLAVRTPVNLQPGGPFLVSSLPNPTPVNLPLNTTPVNLPLNTTPVNKSQNPIPVNLPPNTTPLNLSSNPFPVNLPLNPFPVNLPLNPTPVNLPQNPTPVIVPLRPAPVNLPLNPTPVNLQPEGPIILSSPPALVAGLWADKPKRKNGSTKGAPKQMSKKDKRERPEIQIKSPNKMKCKHKDQVEMTITRKQELRIQNVKVSNTEEIKASTLASNKIPVKQTIPSPTTKMHLPTHSSRGRPLKRKGFPDEVGLTNKVCFPGSEPTVHLCSKRRKTHSEVPASSVHPLEARVVVQQCSRAKVKTQIGLDGVEPQYAEIGHGLVVYVCFFDGATKDTSYIIADTVMNTHFFLDSQSKRHVSVLELPGGVLLMPRESLGWERGPRRTMRSKGVSEAWWGSQLFSSLASHCREMVLQRGGTGGTVEQGAYGQKQEIEMTTSEPIIHVLEF